MENVTKWIEDNPLLAGGIIVVGGLAVLWMLGYIGGGAAAAPDNTAANMAAAYYAAEAAQTAGGTQVQLATVQSAAQTAQVTAQANAAQAIAAAQANMYTTLGQQSQTIAQTNANDALAAANANAAYAAQTAEYGDQANEYTTMLNTIIPQEMATTGGYGNFYGPGGLFASVNTGAPNDINGLISMGYSPSEANAIALSALAEAGQNITPS
jgi:hypothetical protein